MRMKPSGLSAVDPSAVQEQGLNYKPQQYAAVLADADAFSSERNKSIASFPHRVISVHSGVNPATLQGPSPSCVTAVSSSQSSCCNRVYGGKGTPGSRYRNDPYLCSVLSPSVQPQSWQPRATKRANHHLAVAPKSLHTHASPSRPVSTLRSKLDVIRQPQELLLPSQQHQHYQLSLNTGYHGPRWAKVSVKHKVLLCNITSPVAEGQFVVLQGDCDENIGQVRSLVQEEPQYLVQCQVCSVATETEIAALRIRRQKEETAKQFAQKVSDALQFEVNVVDTDFQAEENKLTVYFTTRRQHDFRPLQRQMSKQYGCRTWLVNWTNVVKAYLHFRHDDHENTTLALVQEEPQHLDQCQVCSVATETEIAALRIRRQKEEAAKQFAQKVSDALQFEVNVVDTEFQAEENKLAVYFTTHRQHDFRPLQRQMSKQYGCPIWLVNWTNVVKAYQHFLDVFQ